MLSELHNVKIIIEFMYHLAHFMIIRILKLLNLMFIWILGYSKVSRLTLFWVIGSFGLAKHPQTPEILNNGNFGTGRKLLIFRKSL